MLSNSFKGQVAKGFTLVEMMTVLGIISILILLLVPTLSSTRERARQTSCRGNLHQLIIGASMYAHDDIRGNYSDSIGDSQDVLAFLHPGYVPNTKVFICPSTRNWIRDDLIVTNPMTGRREIFDLTGHAGNTANPGSSYELFGFMNSTADTPNFTTIDVMGQQRRIPGIKKTLASVNGYPHFYDSFGLKGMVAGPSRIWLILDGDGPAVPNNYPDIRDNHRDKGINVAFCDGHVEWVALKQYIKLYEISQDENRQ